MRDIARSRLLMISLVAVLLQGWGLSARSSTEQRPPESMIIDDARFLDADALKKTGEKLKSAARDCGVSIYIVTETYIEGPASGRAQTLTGEWLGEKPGIVLVYARNLSQPGIAASAGLWRLYPADVLARMISQATDAISQSPTKSSVEKLQNATNGLVRDVRQQNKTGKVSINKLRRFEKRMVLFLSSGIAMIGLTLLMLRRNSAPGVSPCLFPEVAVQPRLGAPFSGGTAGVSSAAREV